MNKKIKSYYFNLCIKSITGNINKVEEELLKEWLSKTNVNRAEFNKIKKIWDQSLIYELTEIPDGENEWNELYKTINAPRKESEKFKIINYWRNLVLGRKLKPVFTAAIIVLFLAAMLFVLNKIEHTTVNKTVTTVSNENKQILLSDSSSVTLNSKSTLIFPETFHGNIREVKLKGEAFFSVAKDKFPFVVSTPNAKATVLGTQFDVWSRDGETKVIVKEGIVKVCPKGESNMSVSLTKNQVSVVVGNQKPTSPENVDAGFLLGWLQGNLVFDKTPLYSITGELEKYYNVPVTIQGDNLKYYTLTGSFKYVSIDSVLSMICLALDIRYVKQNGKYYLKSK
jgi:transmembrane sensor